jgi:hypothetical protein
LRQCEEQHALSHRTLRINQKFKERSFLVPIYTRKYIPTQNKFQHTKNARRRDRTGGGGETEEMRLSEANFQLENQKVSEFQADGRFKRPCRTLNQVNLIG